MLHVASPPRDPEAAYRLAVELARYNHEMGIFGEEEFLRQAASHFWCFWWD